ncbi:hypothetical protein [Pleomorphomonas sp. PLEO]|uniref:hypothetical protein n=1 Tax=Pleomorphomonas sp. PLEO TaxID=3239306 RepID=UPI00351E653D
MRCLPKINGIYWLSLAVASVFGASLGDFLADGLGLGHLKGLPYLLGDLALVLLAERFLKYTSTLYFWAAVILSVAAASNVANALHDLHVRLASVPVLCLLLAITVIVWRLREPSADERDFIPVAGFYWATLLMAGVLGGVGGDAAAYPLGFGNFGAMVVFAIPLGFLLTIGRNGLYTDLGFYWLAVVFIVAAGTAAANLLAHDLHSIDLGTAISGAVFVALIVAVYEMRACNKSLRVGLVGEGA